MSCPLIAYSQAVGKFKALLIPSQPHILFVTYFSVEGKIPGGEKGEMSSNSSLQKASREKVANSEKRVTKENESCYCRPTKYLYGGKKWHNQDG